MSMSSPKRVCTSHDGTKTTVEPPPIPVDVLLEILARVDDVATVVRCAATSKTVRRAIPGDPTIGRRVEANGGGALLLGVSYAISEYNNNNYYRNIARVGFVGQAPRQNQLGFDFDVGRLRDSEPVASRGGLIVLLDRRFYPYRFFVFNTATRRTQWVQPPTVNVAKNGGYTSSSYALLTVALLLTVGDAGRSSSFQLLLVSSNWPSTPLSLRTQIYCNDDDDGRWGPVTEITDLPLELKLTWYPPSHRPEALVLGGGGAGTAVHWLDNDPGRGGRCIIRLDIDEARATSIAVPLECVHPPVDDDGELQLAASTDGKLSLVVAELEVISMWTLSDGGPAARWTRQVVISREAIARVPTTGRYKDHRGLFLGFGELSGTVVLLMHHVGLVRINLRTKEALVLQEGSDDEFKEIEAAAHDGFKNIEACLHEIDLRSILLAMKPY